MIAQPIFLANESPNDSRTSYMIASWEGNDKLIMTWGALKEHDYRITSSK